MLKPEIIQKLHIFALSAFAFAQPLYDLLGSNAAFFTVRNNGVADILIFTLFLSLFIPAVLVLTIEATGLFGKSVRKFFHVFILALLFAIIVLPVLKQIPAINTLFTVIFASMLGAGFVFLYLNKPALQLFITYLSPAVLLFPLLFLFNSQTYHLLFPAEAPKIETTNIKSEIPIVMIIFDELPVSTLMSGEHQIDRKLFPGFASLAETATWYTNISIVAEYTIQAIPALLTGNFPSEKAHTDRPKYSFIDWLDLPSYQYHPKNLFTALSSQYELRVFETVSSLCPKSLCEHTYDRSVSLNRQLIDLFDDLFIVYQHIVLPRDMTKKLPRIDMDWSDFFINDLENFHDDLEEDDVASFQRFVDSLTPSNKPTLYFHHTTLPHGPWKYLPSGKSYESPDYSYALAGNLQWEKDANLREPYQRHLLQTMFADKLLANALNKLKQEDIFNDAIIIVTADHGASFKQGEPFREVNQNNYADIMDVPLLIKYPGQKEAVINATKIQSIDIMPILFDALNESYPWEIDGSTPNNKKRLGNDKLPIFLKKGRVKYILHEKSKKLETVEWKASLIGNNGVNGIYGGAEYIHLIGQNINIECARKISDLEITNKVNNFNSINLASNRIPASIMGVKPRKLLAETEVLAVTVNNRIAAVMPSTPVSAGTEYFHTMIDGEFIKNGDNLIDAYILNMSDKCRSQLPSNS